MSERMRERARGISGDSRHAAVYGSLTATLVALYFGGVVGLQAVFRSVTGQGSTLAVVASTLAIAALFNPLRRRMQLRTGRSCLPGAIG